MIMKMVQPSDGSLDSQLIMMRMTMMIVIMFYKMQENVKDNVRIIQYFGSPKFQRPRLSHRWSPPSRTSVRKETLFSCQPENIKSSRTIANPKTRSFQFCFFLTCIMSRNSSSVKEREFVSSNVDRAYAFTNIFWHDFKKTRTLTILLLMSAPMSTIT